VCFVGLFCSTSYAERLVPDKQIDAFFNVLMEGDVRGAVDKLTADTLLKQQKGLLVDASIPQIEAAIKHFGLPERIERVDEKLFGKSFIRYRLITYHPSGALLFWDMIFVNMKNEWQIYVFRFNNSFEVIFKDA
jgi:hypothetical protein